jgi:hypothetical protein
LSVAPEHDGSDGNHSLEGRSHMLNHGTRSAYNRGCRCDECRSASADARRRQREMARERAWEMHMSHSEPAVRSVFLGTIGVASMAWGATVVRRRCDFDGRDTWRWWVVLGGAAFVVAVLWGRADG